MNRKLTIVLVLVALASSSAWASGERVVSKFTSTARAKSVSFKEFSGEGEDGFRALFGGLGGYQLEHVAGDERSWINVRFGKQTVDLYAATMAAGGGTFPHKANDVVEWRGMEKNGRFMPYAIIYRLKAGNDVTRVWHTRLIVIKLDRERPAVIGNAQGANEDVEAKQIADRERPR
jgi:hypothetical protein